MNSFNFLTEQVGKLETRTRKECNNAGFNETSRKQERCRTYAESEWVR